MHFSSLFSRDYWKEAAAGFKRPRLLCLAALFIALHVVLSLIYVPVSENLRIQFTFLADVLCALTCGPLMVIACGVASDLIAFLMQPAWGFFPGYTLSCVLTYVIFALFFYRRRITALNMLLSRLTVNLFINVGLGSLWSAMLMGKAYMVYFGTSLVKNLLMLPIEVVLLYILLRLLMIPMSKLGLIPYQNKPGWLR